MSVSAAPQRPIPPRGRVRSALRHSTVDGLLYAVMVGISESYLGAFAVELGHGSLALGLLATVPLLAGALAQLGSGALAAWLGSRKRLVVTGALVQALSHVWLFTLAHTGETRLWPLLLAKLLFWVSGSAIAPAWGAWIAQLVRGPSRHRFFARRSAAIHLSLVLSFTSAGLFLHGAGGERSALLARFAVLFQVALLARVGSAAALARQADLGRGARTAGPPVRTALREAATQGRFQVAVYIALLMFGAHLSVAYFTPYMLRDLGLDYATFAWLSAVAIVSKVVAFPLWQRMAERSGMGPVLLLSGICVATVPWLWAVLHTVELLVLAQLMSGLAWAGMELSSYQLLLGSAPARCRLAFLSLSNAMSGVAQVAGAVAGAQLMSGFGLTFPELFIISSCARAVPLAVLIARPQWLPRRIVRVITRLASVRPVGGAVERVVSEEDPE